MAGATMKAWLLQQQDRQLAHVLETVASTVAEISVVLREHQGDAGEVLQSGATNTFGDKQLAVDCAVDELIFERLASCSSCCAASSEEQPELRQMPHQGDGTFTVVFDPLDGSSIVGANFSVGTIFGVWPGNGVVGRRGREQVAAAYAVYGPRTLLVWACPPAGGVGSGADPSSLVVQQWILTSTGEWKLMLGPPPHAAPSGADASSAGAATNGGSPQANGHAHGHAAGAAQQQQQHGTIRLAPTKAVFAPANIRCCAHNKVYRQLVDAWIDRGFTLRYTGGMVPDVHHMIAKGGGVFVNPASKAAPAKLRMVFECAPLSLIIEAAGGATSDGAQGILDVTITGMTHRSPIVLGSTELVRESLPAMLASGSA